MNMPVSPIIIPVILSGGAGTRLWPLSRNTRPKQFLHLHGENTLIAETLLRCRGELMDPNPIIVAAESHRFLVAEVLRELEIGGDIILEPMRRDSCAAVVAGALHAMGRSRDALILVVSADHDIPDKAAFGNSVRAAVPPALAGQLVAFGIEPVTPATGYGYLLPGAVIAGGPARELIKFVEKPDRETAEKYLREGYLWNSGNFLFSAKSFLHEAETLAPAVVAAVEQSYKSARQDHDFLRLDEPAFAASPQISFDFAIMEKTSKAAVVAVSYAWSDIGTWDAVANLATKDENGNAIVGHGHVRQGKNVFIHAEQTLVAVDGLTDIVVVATQDSVLVARRGHTEQVKELVGALPSAVAEEALSSLQQHRLWGHYELLEKRHDHEVRRVHIFPGGTIDRQSHKDRAEHWVLVSGQLEVVIGDRKMQIVENIAVTVPSGSVHQVKNTGSIMAILIEVHTFVEPKPVRVG
jgi:mannose-1-phosphate guanylyltransferase / mannose-6-phosphate isomerase